MCNEVKQIVQQSDMTTVPMQIAMQCAPVLTGIKPSNLLIVPLEHEDRVRAYFFHIRIGCFCLCRTADTVYFLVYRTRQLKRCLSRECTLRLLAETGYRKTDFGSILHNASARYEAHMNGEAAFPHEMGLLLGYPVDDVRGFVKNNGEHYLYSGYWKVYADVDKKKRLFRRYERARDRMIRMVASGKGLPQVV